VIALQRPRGPDSVTERQDAAAGSHAFAPARRSGSA